MAWAIGGVPASNLSGKIGPARLLKADGVDHAAATLIGRHRLKQRRLAIQHADARGAVELMARENIEIDIHRLNIDRHMNHALGTIDHHDCAAIMGNRGNLLDRGSTVPRTFETWQRKRQSWSSR